MSDLLGVIIGGTIGLGLPCLWFWFRDWQHRRQTLRKWDLIVERHNRRMGQLFEWERRQHEQRRAGEDT